MILSIDVGIVNLAMVLMDESSNLIVEWVCDGVPPQSEDGLFLSLKKHLDSKPWILQADIVLIEKQPGKNKTMKSVENLIHAYCLIKNEKAETIIYDARHKIPDVAGAGRAQYLKRKKASIDRCEIFLKSNDTNKHWLELFQKSKKKDDLADVVNQALSFTRREQPKKMEAKKAKPLVARKPNENQKNTKYSKCNLAWMVKNTPRAIVEKDKRFLKDLKRYYKDLDELLGLLK